MHTWTVIPWLSQKILSHKYSEERGSVPPDAEPTVSRSFPQNTLFIFINETGICLPFESEVKSKMLANQITDFQYHIPWENEEPDIPIPIYPTPRTQRISYPYYAADSGSNCFIGDLMYHTKEFILTRSPKEVLYGWNVS
jgi:hypothetical protein